MLLEFLKRDKPVLVLVNLIHDFFPELSSFFSSGRIVERSSQLFSTDTTILISIEKVEGLLNFFSLKQLLLVESGCDEFSVINLAVIVRISSLHHPADIRLVQVKESGDFGHVVPELVQC